VQAQVYIALAGFDGGVHVLSANPFFPARIADCRFLI
jgi:hypothetical protein